MHSSTSSSKANMATGTTSPITAGGRPVLYVAVLLALVAAALELIGAIGFVRVSRIQRRIDTDYKAALRLRPIMNGRPTLLVLGNSLLLEGINPPEFQKATASEYKASSFFVEQTTYEDWYYGIRRLFHAGARPSVILLGLSINHLIADGVRREYFARFLMDRRDLASVVRREKLAPTLASTFLFANLSGWVGSKTEIRNWLLVRTMPDIDQFGSLLKTPGPSPPDAARLREILNRRLPELKQVCAQYGARLVLVIPPSQDVREPYQAAEQTGAQTGVLVLVPYRPGEMPPYNYRDGYHLSGDGALLFTRHLARLLGMHGTLGASGADLH